MSGGPFFVLNGAHWLQGENGWGSLGCATPFPSRREAEKAAAPFRAVSDRVDVMNEVVAKEAEMNGWALICNECARGRELKTIGGLYVDPADCAECGARLPFKPNNIVDGNPIRPSEVQRRTLPPELVEERWIVVGGVSIMWSHDGTKRSVVVSTMRRWADVMAWAAAVVLPPPLPGIAPGYVVSCTVHDEQGNPTEASGDDAHVWLPSYVEAVAYARRLRQSILDQAREDVPAEQLSLLPTGSP